MIQERQPPAQILLVMVPGMGIKAADFASEGLVDAVTRRWPITVTPVDPGPDSYLDGSVETRLLDGIAKARDSTTATRVWLAGISLGCQGVLHCIREQPDLAEGLILLTPYLASTGLIAQVGRAGGLRRWAGYHAGDDRERGLLVWLAKALPTQMPRVILGRAVADRFAATANMLAEVLPAEDVVTVPGEHDWTSWRALWHLVLDQNPFSSRPLPGDGSGSVWFPRSHPSHGGYREDETLRTCRHG